MASERWDPFREMMTVREAMDQLLQQSFVRPIGALLPPLPGVAHALPLDLAETANEYVVKASLPGLTPDDVQINLHGNTLTIQAESKAEAERPGQTWLLRERRLGKTQRSITLPTPVDANKANARYEQGVLILTLPKAEEAKAKQIRIQP
ncbi:MAG: Hsp20/alpha crystallin family protein [Chloroflexi bacterium]|nr:Hsp20/alpha crystallin family protein [Chloroflexota bacterium]